MELPATEEGWERLAKATGDTMFMLSNSEHSKKFYHVGLIRFGEFCRAEKVRSITERTVYSALLDFARWNHKKGLRGKTIRGYLFAVRAFLFNNHVKIDEDTYKHEVRRLLPKIQPIIEQDFNLEDLRVLLTKGRPTKKMLGIVLVLLSGGLRLAEALALKVEDLDLNAPVAKVRVSGEYSKNDTPRTVFISDEARETLKPLIENKPKEALVFDYGGPKTSGILWREKAFYATWAEMKKRAGLNAKHAYKSSFGKVHPHLLRKYYFVKGADVIGGYAANALLGHGAYLSTYYQSKSEEERAKDYARLMPYLTVFAEAPVSDAYQKHLTQQLKERDERIARLEESVKGLVQLSYEKWEGRLSEEEKEELDRITEKARARKQEAIEGLKVELLRRGKPIKSEPRSKNSRGS